MSNRIRWTATAYTCDTCKRSIKLPTNQYGVDVSTNCSITQGCRGKMVSLTSSADASLITSVAPDVTGVINWQQRQILQTHTQTVSSPAWVFAYTLSGIPQIHVYTYDASVGDITETTAFDWELVGGVMTITFSTTQYGMVQCITSSPSTNTTAASTTTQASVQISSTAGDVTIATLDSVDQIGVTVTYLPQGTPTPIEYFNIPIGPAITSPWVNVGHAIINGKKYRVRSFNVHTAASAVEYFSTGIISSGTPMYVSHIGAHPIATNSAFILLGKAPYSFVDRIYDRVIDIASISSSQPQMYYSDGRVYTSADLSKNIYPPILVV